jgi:hypothetical protein
MRRSERRGAISIAPANFLPWLVADLAVREPKRLRFTPCEAASEREPVIRSTATRRQLDCRFISRYPVGAHQDEFGTLILSSTLESPS